MSKRKSVAHEIFGGKRKKTSGRKSGHRKAIRKTHKRK